MRFCATSTTPINTLQLQKHADDAVLTVVGPFFFSINYYYHFVGPQSGIQTTIAASLVRHILRFSLFTPCIALWFNGNIKIRFVYFDAAGAATAAAAIAGIICILICPFLVAHVLNAQCVCVRLYESRVSFSYHTYSSACIQIAYDIASQPYFTVVVAHISPIPKWTKNNNIEIQNKNKKSEPLNSIRYCYCRSQHIHNMAFHGLKL